jgi:Homeodomain-like domain
MKGLTFSTKEQNRLQILNGVLEQHWTMQEAAPLLGVSERQGWRLRAAIGRREPGDWRIRTEAESRPTPRPTASRDK